jgi:hypothetical protein
VKSPKKSKNPKIFSFGKYGLMLDGYQPAHPLAYQTIPQGIDYQSSTGTGSGLDFKLITDILYRLYTQKYPVRNLLRLTTIGKQLQYPDLIF